MKKFTSNNQKTGEKGEKIAINYLQSKGFVICETNYTVRLGEIDIIASKKGVWFFCEVKTRTLKMEWLGKDREEIFGLIGEKIDWQKKNRFKIAVEIYLKNNNLADFEFKLLAILIILDDYNKKAFVKIVPF